MPAKIGRRAMGVLQQLECTACPLNTIPTSAPKLEPVGAEAPLLYVLGSEPSRIAVETGAQGPWEDDEANLVRCAVSPEMVSRLRWNTCVRDRPPGNRNPTAVEVECCRPSIERDIAKSQPKAILGLGAIPLQWAVGVASIDAWRGRRILLQCGAWPVWFYPVYHPSIVIRDDTKFAGRDGLRKVFFRDVEAAVKQVWKGEAAQLPMSDKERRAGITCVTTNGRAALSQIIDHLSAMSVTDLLVGIDLETTALRPYGERLLTMAVGTSTDVLAFPIAHSSAGWTPSERVELDQAVTSFLKSPSMKVSHNLTFELEWLGYHYGREVIAENMSQWRDTQAAAYTLDERPGGLSLNHQVQINFGFELKAMSAAVVGTIGQLSLLPLDDILEYNALDTKWCVRLHEVLEQRLKENGLFDVYLTQVRVSPTIALMQLEGIVVDSEKAGVLFKKLEGLIAEDERSIQDNQDVRDCVKQYGMADFNPRSHTDLVVLFRDYLRCQEGVRGDKYSTDVEVLSCVDHPVAEAVLRLRTRTVLKSTFLAGFRQGGKYVYDDGKIHSNFDAMFTRTGRLSSSKPNMQNFPKRHDTWVREIIVPPKDCILLSFDYGQLEARVLAMASCDRTLIKAFWENYDIHMDWAIRFAERCPKLVGGRAGLKDPPTMKKFRALVKNQVVFPTFYGSVPTSIAKALGISLGICDELLGDFWDMFDDVKAWQQRVLKEYRHYGYVSCLTGRRRHGPLPPTGIINSPIQGTASDLVVDAMNRVSELARREGDRYLQPVLNIHDDLTFYVPESKRDEYAARILEVMLAVPFAWCNVPMTVEMSEGFDWHHMTDVEVFSSH